MLLKLGSNNEDVKKLQEKLGLNPDGDFGPVTEAAVKAWQSKNGLTPDGVVGDNTWSKLGLNTSSVSNGPIDLSKLRGHVPESVINQIPMIMTKYNINTKLRLAHFLSQCQHESGNFSLVNENLNYSASRLMEIFPRYFRGKDTRSYDRNPQKIASLVYGNRMGNGGESTGEGYKFRGRGYIQLTGKDNYRAFTNSIGEDCVSNPDLVSTKYPLASAAWFFDKNGINSLSDRGSDINTITAVTKRINGGTIGINDRIKHFNEIYKALS